MSTINFASGGFSVGNAGIIWLMVRKQADQEEKLAWMLENGNQRQTKLCLFSYLFFLIL